MALQLSVASPHAMFNEPFASIVANTLRKQFGDTIRFDSDQERRSEEPGWSGWRKLQEHAVEACGEDKVPHLLAMPAWHGCYLPVDTEPGAFEFNDAPNLDVASLQRLVPELEAVGNALNLPLADDELNQLFDKYMGDDDLVDADMHVQLFTQLLPLARFALEQRE